MSPPTKSSSASSPSSGPALILRPERSRTLLLWWFALHVLAASTLPLLGLPAPGAAALLAALLVHAALRLPGRPVVLVRHRDATWAVPESGLADLRPARGSRYTTGWVRLVLVGRGVRYSVVLFRDQLDPRVWRSLQACLRRTR